MTTHEGIDRCTIGLSLGVSGGRAINRHFAWAVSYAEHLGGRRWFNRRWSVALDHLLPWQVSD